METIWLFLISFAVFAFIVVAMSIRIIRPFEKGLVERLGRFQRILDPGLNLIVPFFAAASEGSVTAVPVFPADRGRFGFQDRGVPVSGAMDLWAHRVGNLLVGNSPEAASLEISMGGLEAEILADTCLAV